MLFYGASVRVGVMRSHARKERGEREKMEKNKKNTLKKIVCGGCTGIANGLFGGGGGMLAVPLLGEVGYSQKTAHATAILMILPVSALSFLLYFFNGLYDFSLLIPVALGVTGGGVLGAWLLDKLPEKSVRTVFAILQATAGVFLILS